LTLCSYSDNISSYMSFANTEKLKLNFSKLSEINQIFILGLMEGLKHAQMKGDGELLFKMESREYKDYHVNNA